MATTTALVSFAEFEALPDRPGKLELLEGEVVSLPPAKLPHGRIANRIHKALSRLLTVCGRNDDHAYVEMGYRLGPTRDTWLQPDVSIQHADQVEGEYLEGAPVLAVEVVSESNTARDLQRKTRLYLENGAREVWIVYPEDRTLWQFLSDGTARLQTGPFATAIFPDRPFPLDSVWDCGESVNRRSQS